MNDEETFFYAPLKAYCELVDLSRIEKSIQQHIHIISEIEDIPIEDVHQFSPNLFLTLTNKCNLSCKYCYAGPSNYDEHDVTKPILKSAIDAYFAKIRSLNLDHAHIGFMGGREPTCAFDLLKYAVYYADEIAERDHISITYSIITNGFYNQEISDFICNHFSRLSLSFDGPEAIQNFQRPTRNGLDSFNRVFKNALKFE